MKANTPEKLYISDYDSEVRYNWHPERLAEKDVKYTRTDAFIDKAATWFANRYQANGSYLCADDIEDFEKYIRG